MLAKQVRIYTIDGRKMVYSFEFYLASGLVPRNYTRWMMDIVLPLGVPSKDYVPAPENVSGRTLRFRLRYYFDIEFAKGLCLVMKRKEAQKIRDFLIENT
jgi:phage anti-repressor protein